MLILRFRGTITGPADAVDCLLSAGSLATALSGESPTFTRVFVGNGTPALPALAFTSATGTGASKGALSARLMFSVGGAAAMALDPALDILIRPDTIYGWNSSANLDIGAADTGLSRLAANTVGLGNGTEGDFTGTLKLGTLNVVTQYQINGVNGASGTGTTITAITVVKGIVTAITVS